MNTHVWEFTNQKKLNKKEFLNYFERKIFKTIRKYNMLPNNKIIKLKNETNTNAIILKQILETKFQTQYSNNPNFSSENQSSIAEKIFTQILQGKFKKENFNKKPFHPLLNHSDKEIQTYAKLKKIKYTPKKKDKKIQNLFAKFLKKNQDLEINIIKANQQLK